MWGRRRAITRECRQRPSLIEAGAADTVALEDRARCTG
jgi:hypothetical protein